MRGLFRSLSRGVIHTTSYVSLFQTTKRDKTLPLLLRDDDDDKKLDNTNLSSTKQQQTTKSVVGKSSFSTENEYDVKTTYY